MSVQKVMLIKCPLHSRVFGFNMISKYAERDLEFKDKEIPEKKPPPSGASGIG